MSQASFPRLPVAAMLVGWAIPIALMLVIFAADLEYLSSVLAAGAAFLAGGLYVGRADGSGPGPSIVALSAPTAILFGMFAWNAESWLLLSIPVVAVAASIGGIVLGLRRRRA